MVKVPDPSNEPRCKIFINSKNWQQEFYQNQTKLKPHTLILVNPFSDYGYYMMKEDYSPTELNFMPIKIIFSSASSEHQLKLDEKARSIDLNRLGHLSVIKPRYISSQLLGTFIKYAVSQCLLDNITNVEASICVRDWLPNMDFLDNNGDRIDSFEWTQPASGLTVGRTEGYQTGGGTDFVDIYTTSTNCNNDRKVYFLYGFKNLKFAGIPRKKDEIPGVQPAVGGPAEVWLQQLRVMFSTIKLAEIADTSLLNEYGTIFFQRPVMFMRAHDMRIIANIKENGIGKTDALKPLGFVVEAQGTMING
jgi:hypothetical protein